MANMITLRDYLAARRLREWEESYMGRKVRAARRAELLWGFVAAAFPAAVLVAAFLAGAEMGRRGYGFEIKREFFDAAQSKMFKAFQVSLPLEEVGGGAR